MICSLPEILKPSELNRSNQKEMKINKEKPLREQRRKASQSKLTNKEIGDFFDI